MDGISVALWIEKPYGVYIPAQMNPFFYAYSHEISIQKASYFRGRRLIFLIKWGNITSVGRNPHSVCYWFIGLVCQGISCGRVDGVTSQQANCRL